MWDISVNQVLSIILANVLGMLVGFMLGVLIRNSAGAVVGYFVFAFVLPTLSALLAGSQAWFRDLQPWVDFNFAQTQLYDGALTAAEWAHLGRHQRDLGAGPAAGGDPAGVEVGGEVAPGKFPRYRSWRFQRCVRRWKRQFSWRSEDIGKWMSVSPRADLGLIPWEFGSRAPPTQHHRVAVPSV